MASYKDIWLNEIKGTRFWACVKLTVRPPLFNENKEFNLDELRELAKGGGEFARRIGFLIKDAESCEYLEISNDKSHEYRKCGSGGSPDFLFVEMEGTEAVYRMAVDRYRRLFDEFQRDARMAISTSIASEDAEIRDIEYDFDLDADEINQAIEKVRLDHAKIYESIQNSLELDKIDARDDVYREITRKGGELDIEKQMLKSRYEGDYRVEKIASSIVAGFNEYQMAIPKKWGNNGGLIFQAYNIVVYPIRGDRWAVFEYPYKLDDDYDEKKNEIEILVNHSFTFPESLVKYRFSGIKRSYHQFHDIESLTEYLNIQYKGIDFVSPEDPMKSLFGIKICNISLEETSECERYIRTAISMIRRSIGAGKIDDYLPDMIVFEESDGDDSTIGLNTKVYTPDNKEDSVIVIDPYYSYDTVTDTIIHEICHNILDRNARACGIIKQEFQAYCKRNPDFTSFGKGDLILVKKDGHDQWVEFVDKYDPSRNYAMNDERPTYVRVRDVVLDKNHNVLERGDIYAYNKIAYLDIKSIIKGGNGEEKRNQLRLRQYAVVNLEEFTAVILSKYCSGQLPEKISRIVRNKIIPVL